MDLFGFYSVERDRLREKERQARQQMQSQAEQREQNMVEAGPLFDAPVRVSGLFCLVYEPGSMITKWSKVL